MNTDEADKTTQSNNLGKDLFSKLYIADFKYELHLIFSKLLSCSSNQTTLIMTDDHKSLCNSLAAFKPNLDLIDLSNAQNLTQRERFSAYFQKVPIITTVLCTLSDLLFHPQLYLFLDSITIVLFTCKLENIKENNSYNFFLTLLNNNYHKYQEKENCGSLNVEVNVIVNSLRLIKKVTKRKHYYNFINNFKIYSYCKFNNEAVVHNPIKVLNSNSNHKKENQIVIKLETIQERTFTEINSVVKFNNNILKEVFHNFLKQKRGLKYLNHLQKILKFDKRINTIYNCNNDENKLIKEINKKFPGYSNYSQVTKNINNTNNNSETEDILFINRNSVLLDKLEIFIQLNVIKYFILHNDAYFVLNYLNSLLYSKNLFFSVSESFKSIKEEVGNLLQTNEAFNKLEVLYNFIKSIKRNHIRNKDNTLIVIICSKRNHKDIKIMLNLLNLQKDYKYIQNAIQYKDCLKENNLNFNQTYEEGIISNENMIQIYSINDYLYRIINDKIDNNEKENIIICFDHNLEILHMIKYYKYNKDQVHTYIIQNNFKSSDSTMKDKVQYIKEIKSNFETLFINLKTSDKSKRKLFNKLQFNNKENRIFEIIIDKREFKSTLPFHLYNRKFIIKPKMLITGDYIINDIIIERKSFNDLIQSVMNLRLLSQTSRIMKQFNVSFIVIEKTFFESHYFGFLEWLLEYYKLFDVNIFYCGTNEMTIQMFEWIYKNTELIKNKYKDIEKKKMLVKHEIKHQREQLRNVEVEIEKREEINSDKNVFGFEEIMELVDGLEKNNLEFIKENKISIKDLANYGIGMLKELFGNVKGPRIYKFFNDEV
eukprot:GAHX01001806.1.p1 GENE.GAHX01001806.1~~GAHX01001806.1.p1  ORF type:complete len:823 (+),score=191.91 GAHX01001806.1:324-2792(+)